MITRILICLLALTVTASAQRTVMRDDADILIGDLTPGTGSLLSTGLVDLDDPTDVKLWYDSSASGWNLAGTEANFRSELGLTSAATGSAAGLTNDTLPDARLSSNVVTVSNIQTISGTKIFTGTLGANGLLNAPTQLFWMGVGGQASITSSGGRHGLIVRAPSGNGAAIIGWASSGAVAGKFYQDTAYTSPAVFVGRAATSASTPVVSIGASTVTGTHSMIEVQGAGGAAVVTARGDGAVSSLYQRFGSGAPTGVVSAPVGAIYHRTDGGAATSFYVKESGGTGNTGWVAK